MRVWLDHKRVLFLCCVYFLICEKYPRDVYSFVHQFPNQLLFERLVMSYVAA
jgi:hypothetical protein